MRERIESEATDCRDSSWVRIGVVAGILGVVVSAYSLYYRIKHNNPSLEKLEDPPTQNKQSPNNPVDKKLDNLD